jgi:hypothetical protein
MGPPADEAGSFFFSSPISASRRVGGRPLFMAGPMILSISE